MLDHPIGACDVCAKPDGVHGVTCDSNGACPRIRCYFYYTHTDEHASAY